MCLGLTRILAHPCVLTSFNGIKCHYYEVACSSLATWNHRMKQLLVKDFKLIYIVYFKAVNENLSFTIVLLILWPWKVREIKHVWTLCRYMCLVFFTPLSQVPGYHYFGQVVKQVMPILQWFRAREQTFLSSVSSCNNHPKLLNWASTDREKRLE